MDFDALMEVNKYVVGWIYCPDTNINYPIVQTENNSDYLRRKLDGISNTVLASSLKELEEAGLVKRTEYLEVPVRVEYCSTEKADRLMPVLEAFSQWGEEMMEE